MRYYQNAQRMQRAKRPPKLLSPINGFWILSLYMVLAFIATVILSFLSFGLAISAAAGVSGALVLLAFVFTCGMCTAIPALLGVSAPDWGWLLGVSYSFLFTFLYTPYIFGLVDKRYRRCGYLWFAPGDYHVSIWYLFIPLVFMITASVVSSLGSSRRGRLTGKRFVFERPLASIIPLVCISIAISALSPFILDAVIGAKPEPAKTIKFPAHGFQVLKPEWWREGHKYHPEGYTSSNHKIREGAILEVILDSPSYAPQEDRGQAEIFVYSNMPFTGVSLESFKSAEEVYENLLAVLEDVKRNPSKYLYYRVLDGKLETQDLAEFKYYGDTKIGGLKAIRIGFTRYEVHYDQWGKPENYAYARLPPTSPYDKVRHVKDNEVVEEGGDIVVSRDGEIVVWKEPHLYWLEIHASPETYEKIKDSFKFI